MLGKEQNRQNSPKATNKKLPDIIFKMEYSENPVRDVERRKKELKERIVNWFSDKKNIYFLLILAAALIIRLYFFYMTQTQPLWWDEAEYGLRAKAFAFGTPITGWAPEREIIIPLLFAFVLKLGGTEVSLRLLQLLVSFATVFMTYIVISKLTSKTVGLYASFGMAFFWLHIFFTQRVLLYMWAPLFFLVIIYFFYTGYLNSNKKHLIAFAVLASIGLQVYFSIGFLLFGIFIYLLLIEGFSLFKNKKAWTVLAIFILVLAPYMIYAQSTYGYPVPRIAIGYTATTQEPGAGISGLLAYVNMFPSRVGWTFTILSFLGMMYFLFNFALGFGIKGYLKKNKNWLLVFTTFFITLLFYTLYGVIGGSGTFYDAFILPVFPFAFAFAGLFLDRIHKYFSKYGKIFALVLVIVLLSSHAYQGLVGANNSIKGKFTSYDSVKFAGIWIQEHSNPDDKVISRSVPQNTYYSERETHTYPKTEEEFIALLEEIKPKYIVDSVWESTAQWIHEYPSKNPDKVNLVQAYFFDEQKTQPSLAIYEVIY